MARFKFGQPPEGLESLFDGAAVLLVHSDAQQEQHLQVLRHHPGFGEAVRLLQEDLDAVGIDFTSGAHEVAQVQPDLAPYPVRRFAEDWGLSPAASAALALIGFDRFREVVDGTHDVITWQAVTADKQEVMTWETSTSYTIRIPRPLTKARRDAVTKWLAAKRRQDGSVEQAWGLAGKKRQDLNPALIEALPWFDRWQNGEEPAEIWRSLLDEHPKLDFDSFVAQLTRVWDQMRSLQEEGVRPDRPSRARS